MDADAASRYKKIVADPESMDDLLVDLFLEAHDTSPAELLAKGENPRFVMQRLQRIPSAC